MYKQGKCKDCNYNGKLIAGRCKSHYWMFRQKENSKKKKDKPKTSDWYMVQRSQIPTYCEECGDSLEVLKHSSYWRAIVAHIVPKRRGKYPSVAKHPLNRMFFCDLCHNRFDNLGIDEALKFKSLPTIKSRFKHVYRDMSDEEKNKAEIEYEFLLKN